ncbi:MAG: hypothetical protein JWO42_2656 [Chloroflexi bacterium]|nr:hypothetical protein [Chloroflexota bacterium]
MAPALPDGRRDAGRRGKERCAPPMAAHHTSATAPARIASAVAPKRRRIGSWLKRDQRGSQLSCCATVWCFPGERQYRCRTVPTAHGRLDFFPLYAPPL